MKIGHIIILTGLLCCSLKAGAQLSSVKNALQSISQGKKATVGIAVYDFERGDTLTLYNSIHFPMQSVYKVHLALAVLKKVDAGLLSLDQKIKISKQDLRPGTWSPLQKKFPEGNIELDLRDLLRYTISNSDNNTCDILFRLVGGPPEVNSYIHRLHVKDVHIAATELEMTKGWEVQYSNWSTPFAATALLYKAYRGHILSDSSLACLDRQLTISENAADRLKGKLPAAARVAHKTGTSDRNEAGLRAATNDIGVITTPGGKQYAIAVFVTDSKENDQVNAAMIADISKAVWDYFMEREKSAK
jgi:beta-lactamase class A